MPFSRGSSQPRSPALQADSLPFELLGKLSQEGQTMGGVAVLHAPLRVVAFLAR